MPLLAGARHANGLGIGWVSAQVDSHCGLVIIMGGGWKESGGTTIVHIACMLFFSLSRLYCGGGGAIKRLVVSLFVGVGLMVGNGQCVIGQSSLMRLRLVKIVTLVVSWFPGSGMEGERLSHHCLAISKWVVVLSWHIGNEGSWSFLLWQFGFAMGLCV